MNIVITSSKMQYKANDGGVTRRIPEHFTKRTVFFEANGEERRIFISKDDLPREATEEDIISYIENNFDESNVADEKYEQLQRDLDNAIIELSMAMSMQGGNH